MANQKGPGSLRDFRIDQKSSAEVPAPTGRQQVRTRQSSVHEWGYADQEQESIKQLWPDFQNTTEVDLSKPVKMANPRSESSSEWTLQGTRTGAPLVIEGETPLKSETPKMQPWAVELAMDERRMEAQGTVEFTNSYQKQELLKIRTREYLQTLQEGFRQQVELFNESRRSATHAIHIYKVSKAEGDFMLFRNGVKLVVSGQRAGKIIFAFNQYLGQIFAPSQAPVIEVEASWGPFDQLFWSFKGERIQVLDLLRYFLTEFSKQSYR